MMALWGLSLLFAAPVHVQGQQETPKLLNGMPPEVLAKSQSLAHILRQGLPEGKVTEHQT